jgi:hypothetical protein
MLKLRSVISALIAFALWTAAGHSTQSHQINQMEWNRIVKESERCLALCDDQYSSCPRDIPARPNVDYSCNDKEASCVRACSAPLIAAKEDLK